MYRRGEIYKDTPVEKYINANANIHLTVACPNSRHANGLGANGFNGFDSYMGLIWLGLYI
jgi:hypothetical protein